MTTNKSLPAIPARTHLTPALAKERDFAAAVLSTVGALVIVLDRHGRIVEFNQACEQLTGYTFEEVEGRIFWDFLLLDREVEPVKAVFAGLASGAFPSHFENFWCTRSGERKWISWSNTVLADEDGDSVAYVIGTGIDITERQCAEEALRTSEEQLRLITDNLPVLISYIDKHYRYRFNNRAYEQWFDVKREDIYGKHAGEVLGKATFENVKTEMKQALSGVEVNFEAKVPYKSGGERFVNASYIPHIDATGIVKGFFVLVQDITERKRDEERTRHYQEELAHVSRINIMGELATGLAHELNQPLAAIHCYAETALGTSHQKGDNKESRQVTKLLEKIVTQADRAGKIIRRLRELVRKRSVTKVQVDIAEVVRQVIDLIEPNLRRYDINLKLNLDGTLPPILADNIQLSQVLLNLANNAIQAMAVSSAKSRQLIIRGQFLKDHVLISVSDTGLGMDEVTLKKIFQPFVGAKHKDGLGMGLAISRSIIEAHQGTLWAESQPGRGSSFFIRLPC